MLEGSSNPLREISYSGGLGFCYDTDRTMFRDFGRADGPLVVALDGNLVIDTLNYGATLLDGEPLPSTLPANYVSELDAWGALLDVWMLRDIRFIPLPALDTDARRDPTEENRVGKSEVVAAVAQALAFQMDDWEIEIGDIPSVRAIGDHSRSSVEAALSVLDARIFLEGADLDVDVFLTRDRRVHNRIADLRKSDLPNAWMPTELLGRLDALGVGHLRGGNMAHPGCAYDHDMLLPDIGKWVGLLAAMGV